MAKLLKKIFIPAVVLYTTLILLIFFISYSFGFNINRGIHIFQSVVPDSYLCPAGCNICSFNIHKFGLFYGSINSSCTLLGCPANSYKEDHQLCSKDWKKSSRLTYNHLPEFTNYCLNDYRNITYQERQQKANPGFSLSDSQSLIHTKQAITQGRQGCMKVYKWLKKKNRFTDRDLQVLGTFLGTRKKLNPNHRLTRNLTKQEIIRVKEMFDSLQTKRNRFRDIISDTMLQQFQNEYEVVINSAPEAIEQSNNF